MCCPCRMQFTIVPLHCTIVPSHRTSHCTIVPVHRTIVPSHRTFAPYHYTSALYHRALVAYHCTTLACHRARPTPLEAHRNHAWHGSWILISLITTFWRNTSPFFPASRIWHGITAPGGRSVSVAITISSMTWWSMGCISWIRVRLLNNGSFQQAYEDSRHTDTPWNSNL